MTSRITPRNLTTELTIAVPQYTFRKMKTHHPNFSQVSLKDAPHKVCKYTG